ncbi:hypothetical protein [Polaromonas sp.]|uniref:hypothetical protein n=1 Tax=Polaromonas sp. TaxID=1869339 RepID=UPI00286B58C8|nr:hypothetical protein [Polaromonas sp.]
MTGSRLGAASGRWLEAASRWRKIFATSLRFSRASNVAELAEPTDGELSLPANSAAADCRLAWAIPSITNPTASMIQPGTLKVADTTLMTIEPPRKDGKIKSASPTTVTRNPVS